MATQIDTIFGRFESPEDNIGTTEFGGCGHSTRRTFGLVDKANKSFIGGVDIQGEVNVRDRVTEFLTDHGFRKISNEPS